eukprot:365926-Chlamydomonas_euryale.AAC.8
MRVRLLRAKVRARLRVCHLQPQQSTCCAVLASQALFAFPAARWARRRAGSGDALFAYSAARWARRRGVIVSA